MSFKFAIQFQSTKLIKGFRRPSLLLNMAFTEKFGTIQTGGGCGYGDGSESET